MKEAIKQEIQELLSDSKAREAIDIIKALNYSKDLDSLIMETIQEMVLEYDLYMTKHGRYLNFKDSEASKDLYKGFFESSRGEYGFVVVQELSEDIFIPRDFKNSAMDGDLVLVKITKGSVNNKKCEGEVVKIIKRNPKTKVAEVIILDKKYYCLLKNSKNSKLPLSGLDIDKLVDGDLITINILNDNKKGAKAIFKSRIGHKNDPGIDIVAVLAEHDFEVEFNSDVLEELKRIPSKVLESDLKGRVDLRDEEIFTIDGDDTKDIDDAISLKELPNGNYELGVHIADVSYYVKEDSALDKEARKRGTSVYLADRVVPMLPHQLSNGICSLNPNVDRLTISCVSEIDNKGNIVDYKIFPSVIKSRIQMTYNKVNEILEKGHIPDGYQEFADTLKKMANLAKIIRENKIKKGYIDFDVSEAKIVVDSNGKVLDVTKRYRGVGENLIEDFMIIANECVATYIYNTSLPGIYRVHGDVNTDRLRKFITLLNTLGIEVKENLNHKANQKVIQKIISTFKNHKAFQVLSTQMLSCMDKAKYQTNNIGHFALGLRNYTHFTSPIRRYPDTTCHRLLREYFFRDTPLTEEVINHFENILDEIALTSSERERASAECEREVTDMKMAEYMEEHLGETYQGMVSGVTSFGMFVLLKDKLIEGMVRLETLEEEFIYDPAKEWLISNSKKIYTLGTEVLVQVINASRDTGKIDFVIVKDDLSEN